MKVKLRKRAISLLLVLLMLVSSFTPHTVYAVDAGSNDNDAGGQRVPATYNMHGWGAMVTLVTLKNPYTEKELDKLAEDYEKNKDKTSVAINHLIAETYLEEFPDFWLKSSTASNSCLIMIEPSSKQFEATNKFVGTDGNSAGTKIANSYRAADGDSSGKIQVVADKIKADNDLLIAFEDGELTWNELKMLIDSSKLESSKKAFLGMFKDTAKTATLLNNLLNHTESTDNALQYLDVLITVQSLIGGKKCVKEIEAYLQGLNRDSADQFVVISIASVVSDSDSKAWLWFTIPSWYDQIKESGKTISTQMKGRGIEEFFNEYEKYVSKTTPNGGAATLKKHRAWGWWHVQVSGYNAPKLSKWATTFRPTDKNGQMEGNTGYTFYGGDYRSIDTPDPVRATIPGNVEIHVISPDNPETVAEKGDTSTAVVEISLSSEDKLKDLKDNLTIIGANKWSADIEIVVKGSKMDGSGENPNFLDEEQSKHPLSEIGATFKKGKDGDKSVWTWKLTLKGRNDPKWCDKLAKTGLYYYMRAKSPYLIKFTDTDVTVEDATTNKYEVYVKWTVKDENGVEQSTGYFTPEGQTRDEELTYEDAEGNKLLYISYDTAEWKILDAGIPTDPPLPSDTPTPDISSPPPSGEPDPGGEPEGNPGGNPGGNPEGTPTPAATPTPAGTPTPTPTPTPSPSPTPTPFIPETDEYYSKLEEPYVEIKEGTPGNETFEAMAGVPTTENLYIGFGANEFLMNMELEHAKSEENEDRLYTLTYTVSQCAGVNTPCSYSCPGHTVTSTCGGSHVIGYSEDGPIYCSEGTGTIYCSTNGASTTVSCTGGGSFDCKVTWGGTSYSISGTADVANDSGVLFGVGHQECISKIDGSNSPTGGGFGCQHNAQLNESHTHEHKYVGTVKQPITDFDYIDITNLQMWRLSDLRLESEEGLFTTPNVNFDPLTGYQLFYDQNHYENNNGRLVFSFNWKDNERFGNATTEKTDGEPQLEVDADQHATDWFNETVCSGQETKMTVVSDYVNMETTEGYQIPCYHQYDSDTVVITDEQFSPEASETAQSSNVGQSITYTPVLGTKKKEIGGNEIIFSEDNPIPKWGGEEEEGSSENEFWGTNPYSFVYGQNGEKWADNELVRSGYNGRYNSPSTKWNNGSRPASLTYINPVDWLRADHPNADWLIGSRDFRPDGFTNTRLTYQDLDIIDSTNPVTKMWSDQDDLEPVYNGIWDTGKCYITYTKIAEYEGQGELREETDREQMVDFGVDYEDHNDLDDGSDYVREVGYRAGQQEVNDIVVYDPVSTQYAVVLSNDSKYDMRTDASIADGGDPVRDAGAGCPYDETCSYAVLTCMDHGSLHTMDCYIDIVAGVNHIGGMNAHVHTKACYATHVHTDECYEGGLVKCSSCSGSGTYAHHSFPGGLLGSGCEGCGWDGVTGWKQPCMNSPCSTCNGTGYKDDRILICTKETGGKLTLPMMYDNHTIVYEYGNTTAEIDIDATHVYRLYQHDSGCAYEGLIHLYDVTSGHCLCCNHSCTGSLLAEIGGAELAMNCKQIPNKHECTPDCSDRMKTVLVCDDPHHHSPNEPWDYNAAKSHYSFGDLRCYSPCGNDANHQMPMEVPLPDAGSVSMTDVFINIDREFEIYYPDLGDFAQQPSLYGIAEVSRIRGKGYTDAMDVGKWMRSKYVTFPINVVWYENPEDPENSTSYSYEAGTPIDLLKLSYNKRGKYFYTFYAVLGNNEKCNAVTSFDAIAVNAMEIDWYRENQETRNLDRDMTNYAARHTGYKWQYIDVVGSIGSLSINDTGDFRFSTLFKQAKDPNQYGWLIENIVPKVDYRLPRFVVTDQMDVRQEVASAVTRYHDTYGTLFTDTGGKAYETKSLPLSMADSDLVAVQNQQLHPGYQLYMDVETIGDYYGENRNELGKLQDSLLTYKMQITPRYWELDLDTGVYTPVDVYMSEDGRYTRLCQFYNPGLASDWYYYVDWTEEADRRNYTEREAGVTENVQIRTTIQETEGSSPEKVRVPIGRDVIGTAAQLFLNDLNRTFIGSTGTYGVTRNPQDLFTPVDYQREAQRWHFTLGLPSSSVFVYAEDPCTTENIEELRSHNAVIVCTINILVKGSVWTLEYDGTPINLSDGGGIQVEEGGKIYPPPTEPVDPNNPTKPGTGEPVKDPVIVVYENDLTASDDLKTEGSH